MTRSKDNPGIDKAWHAALGQLTGGLSPAAVATAYVDWALHLMASPDKQADLLRQPLAGNADTQADQDPRFLHPSWATFPYNYFAQGFLMAQTGGIPPPAICPVSTRNIRRSSTLRPGK